ncbi:MAG: hypothetical protein ACREX9_20575 [Gammaproteobacteria bacterium]
MAGSRARLICFDLEGPLSPQDNAFEVAKRLDRGERLFEALSRYDDILALRARPGYEAGDTLKLVLPFLLSRGIRDGVVRSVSHEAELTDGAMEVIEVLQRDNHHVHVVSTSYRAHAEYVAGCLNIEPPRVHSSPVSLDALSDQAVEEDFSLVREVEEQIHSILGERGSNKPDQENALVSALDSFYNDKLPRCHLGVILGGIEIMGGRRKCGAIHRLSVQCGTALADVAFIGDSITDRHALQFVEAGGGLAIAFNANEYALPVATAAVASPRLDSILQLLIGWLDGGRAAVRELAQSLPRYDWVAGRSDEALVEALPAHRRIRNAVRHDAGRLG